MPSQRLSWTLPLLCFCPHFHAALALSSPPLDLLAYPAYSVQLRPDLPISNTSAQRILSGNGDDTNDEVVESPRTGLLLKRDGDEAQAASSDAIATKPYLLRSPVNGQAYLCSVPQQSQASEARSRRDGQSSQRPRLTAEERSEKRRKSEEEKRQAYERGLALLEPLKGSCLYLTQGWFTYGFCHGSEIRQFHAIRTANPGGHGLSEDLSQESYTLGQFTNRVVEDEGLVDTKRARALGSLREILESDDKVDGQALEIGSRGRTAEDDDISVDEDKRYLVQLWTGGTLCDKTGAERKTEVQFHCNSQTTDRIFLIRETAICEYVIVIHTPRLCGEPIFVGSGTSADEAARAKKKKAVSAIECRPVLRDDAPALLAAPVQSAPATGLLLQQPALLSEDVVTKHQEQIRPPHEEQEVPSPASPDTPPEDTPVPPLVELKEANSVVQEILAERAAQDPPASPESQTPDSDKDVMLDYVLVMDPATGEISVESDSDGKAGEGGSTLEPLQEIIKLLRQSLEDALNIVHPDERPEDTPVELGQAQQTQHPITRQTNANNKKLQDSLSRFHKAGARNHKAIAEQFLKGQLKEPKRKGQQPQQRGEQHPQRQMGTPQHRNLKKAFDTNWDEEQAEKDKRLRDEL